MWSLPLATICSRFLVLPPHCPDHRPQVLAPVLALIVVQLSAV
jgi:hypothetical protein